MDLEKLKQRATAHCQAAADPVGRPRRPRFGRRRLAIWAVELLVLAVVFEIFVWQPWRARSVAHQDSRRGLPIGEALPPLAATARPLAGLQEVSPSFLAALDGLGTGAALAAATQRQVSEELGLPVEVENSLGMRFRLIPNGTFLMGSPADEPGRWEGEFQHVREIPAPFYMGKWEVTQAQWEAVMGPGSHKSGFKGARRPVEEVSWYDCQRFVVKLNEREGLPKWTYRLPSEAEWEYACRAGADTAYHFGGSPNRLAAFDFFEDNSNGRTQAAGLKRPNAFGLHDMHGNVWEWCRDIFDSYPGSPLADDTGGQCRSIRGGNWYVRAPDCRAAERTRLTPTSHGNMLGLRIMRVIPELAERPAPAPLPPAESRSEPPAADESGLPEGGAMDAEALFEQEVGE